LHHELVLLAGSIKVRKLSDDIPNFCGMLIGDILDIYQNSFTHTITNNFLGKTRTIDDVSNGLFKKAMATFRLLNAYSLNMLGSAQWRGEQ
jgi:hypothetical protein